MSDDDDAVNWAGRVIVNDPFKGLNFWERWEMRRKITKEDEEKKRRERNDEESADRFRRDNLRQW